MNLFLLKPIHTEGDDPWSYEYDACFGFVVRAENETEARLLAHNNAGDENDDCDGVGRRKSNTTTPWLDPKYSTCVVLKKDGDAGVIIKDFVNS